MYARWNIRHSIFFKLFFYSARSSQAEAGGWCCQWKQTIRAQILFRNSVWRERKRCWPHNYCIGLDSFTFHLKDDWWLHNCAIYSGQKWPQKPKKRAGDRSTPDKWTVQGRQMIGLHHRITRDIFTFVTRHYPCSCWWRGGKCSMLTPKCRGGGGGGGAGELLGFWHGDVLLCCYLLLPLCKTDNKTVPCQNHPKRDWGGINQVFICSLWETGP